MSHVDEIVRGFAGSGKNKSTESCSKLKQLLAAKRSAGSAAKSSASNSDERLSVIASCKIGKVEASPRRPSNPLSPTDWRRRHSPSNLWAELTTEFLETP